MARFWWHRRVAALAAAGLAVTGAGTAVVLATSSTVVLAADGSGSTSADRYRALVFRLAFNDPRWEVRSAAKSALVSDLPNAITAFLSSGGGYEAARTRAVNDAARNDLIISRTVATTTEKTSPIVHLTAMRASHGSLDEKDAYVRTGLKQAQDLDAKHSPLEQARQQAQQDREYVADLAVHAGGAWVRAAAARATQVGTDAEIAEFFKYSWASAADCDVQAYRLDAAEQDLRARHQIDLLIVAAQQAQQAYEQAADAAKAKAAAEARSAWGAAADLASTTQASWQANIGYAQDQAASWQQVHDFAVTAATQQDWSAIASQAAATGGSWADELTWAQQQAQTWTQVADSSRASADAIPSGPAGN